MTPDREFFKWVWPEWDIVFPIDLMLSVAIMGVGAAVALVNYQPYLFRAKLAEAMYAAGNKRYELIEQLALSGDPLEIPLADSTGPVSAATMEELLSGRKAADRKPVDLLDQEQAKKAFQEERKAKEAGEGSSRYVSSTQIVGSAIVVSGKIDGRDYELGMFPAALDEETPSVYIWLCGRSRIPEGWLAQPPALTNVLPGYLMDRKCRRGRGT